MKAQRVIPCKIAELPEKMWVKAAQMAMAENPSNRPNPRGVALLSTVALVAPIKESRIAALASKIWAPDRAKWTVQFLDATSASLKAKILKHANMWGETANVEFVETGGTGDVRLGRRRGEGHYSYLGVDNQALPRNQKTMNLELGESSPDSEFMRVVPHEFGHFLAFPHEHSRPEVIADLDEQAVIRLFQRTQGWSEAEIRAQILTPIPSSALLTGPVDRDSVMCYSFPASVTKTGTAIIGGSKITPNDAAFCAQLYPRAPVPPPPTLEDLTFTVAAPGTYKVVKQ